MSDILVDLVGPGARLAKQYADMAAASVGSAGDAVAGAWDAAEAAGLAAATAPMVYASTAAGLAAVAEGATFWVPVSGGGLMLYRKTAGVAVAVTPMGKLPFRTLSSLGAVAGVGQVNSIAMASGSATITSAANPWTAADVGKTIVVPGAGAAGAKLTTTIAAYVSAGNVTLAAAASTAASGGATWGTNCSAALQAGLDWIATSGGGAVVLDAEYLLTGTVIKNFNTLASAVHLLAFGGGALYIACGATATAITLQNVTQLDVQGIDFVGTPGESNDCKVLFDLQTCLLGTIHHNGFYGLASMSSAGRCLIRSSASRLTVSDNNFAGCMVGGASLVYNHSWAMYTSLRNRFIDYGQRKSILHSKTFMTTGLAWELLENPEVSTTNGGSFALFENNHYDEGTRHLVLASPTVQRISGVQVKSCRFSLNPAADANGIHLVDVDDAKIEHCYMGYVSVQRAAVYLQDVTRAVIDGCSGNGFADTIEAHSVGTLDVSNSPTLDNYLLDNVGKFVLDGSPQWASYVPVVGASSGALGANAAAATYRMDGDLCHITLDLYVGDNGTAGFGVTLSLPFPAEGLQTMSGRATQGAGGALVGGSVADGSSTLTVVRYDGAHPVVSDSRIVLTGAYRVDL